MKKNFTYIIILLAVFLAFKINVSGQVTHLVISQVYGGGGNSGATYGEDYIEIFNPTASAVSLNGWSVQYAAKTGTSWTATALPNYSLASGKYFLIGEYNGGSPALPTPDATGTTNLAQAGGKVALVSSTTALSGSCPSGGSIVDFVGFGNSSNAPNCYEGTSYAPSANSATSCEMRASSGCTDVNDNSTDLSSATPNPRNTATAAHVCSSCTAPTSQASIGSYTNNTTGTTLTVNWTRGNGTGGVIVVARLTATTAVDPTSGTSYTANVAFGSGNTTGTGNYVVYKGTGSTVAVTTLTSGTNYTFTVYEYNTTSTCYDIPGSSSAVTTFGTYCTNTNTTNTIYYVNDFSTTGGTTNITNNNSGFSANGYGNFTAKNVTQNIGSSVNFSVDGDVNGGTYGFGIWVDWNQNGSFADAGEQVYASGSSYVSSATGSFSVPAGALTGTTRMRVVGDWLTTAPVACPGTAYSECEDYDFTVTASACTAPTTQAKNLTFTPACTQMNVSWTNGNGSKRIVICNTVNTFTNPTNGTDPNANPIYSAGQQVVYNGTGNSVTVTGLTAGTTYWFKVFEANCSGTTVGFDVGAGTNNPLSQATSPATPATPGAITGTAVQCPNATGQAYSINAVTNATSYTWTVPTGWTITGGQGTNAITVITGATGQGGNITVTASNSCGTSAASSLAVTITATTPTAGPDQYLCYTATLSTTMAANNATGTWSMISGPNTPNIVSAATYNTQIGTVTHLNHGTYVFRWSSSCAGSYDDVVIVVQ